MTGKTQEKSLVPALTTFNIKQTPLELCLGLSRESFGTAVGGKPKTITQTHSRARTDGRTLVQYTVMGKLLIYDKSRGQDMEMYKESSRKSGSSSNFYVQSFLKTAKQNLSL